MTDRIFIDTNIIVYTLDSENILKQTKAKVILDQFYSNQNYIISTQVVQEFCNVALRKLEPQVPEKMLSEFIATFPSGQIELINLNTIDKALSVKTQYKYSFWDSLIIASAIHAGCNLLYTEDLKDHQSIDNLMIVNPFK
jgi:predicted nucleic acid-binding protein